VVDRSTRRAVIPQTSQHGRYGMHARLVEPMCNLMLIVSAFWWRATTRRRQVTAGSTAHTPGRVDPGHAFAQRGAEPNCGSRTPWLSKEEPALNVGANMEAEGRLEASRSACCPARFLIRAEDAADVTSQHAGCRAKPCHQQIASTAAPSSADLSAVLGQDSIADESTPTSTTAGPCATATPRVLRPKADVRVSGCLPCARLGTCSERPARAGSPTNRCLQVAALRLPAWHAQAVSFRWKESQWSLECKDLQLWLPR
jgi:hypothetical protein